MSKHTLSVLVENKPGVLARVSGLFSRRGFNIESLAVGPTEHADVSRMTIVVAVEDFPLESLTIEATGTAEKIAALLKNLEPYGIREMVQSGTIAVGRGPRSITVTAVR